MWSGLFVACPDPLLIFVLDGVTLLVASDALDKVESAVILAKSGGSDFDIGEFTLSFETSETETELSASLLIVGA